MVATFPAKSAVAPLVLRQRLILRPAPSRSAATGPTWVFWAWIEVTGPQVSGAKPFVVVVDDKEDLQALDAVVPEDRRAELAWLAAARKNAGIAWLRGTALSEARRQIRVEQQRLPGRCGLSCARAGC